MDPSLKFRTEKIFVGNLPPAASRQELHKYFAAFGRLVDCVIMTNRDGSGRGFGFAEFENAESVDLVMDHFNSHFIRGQVRKSEQIGKNDLSGLRLSAQVPRMHFVGFAGSVISTSSSIDWSF